MPTDSSKYLFGVIYLRQPKRRGKCGHYGTKFIKELCQNCYYRIYRKTKREKKKRRER